jgi:hypothetical protein
VILFLISTGSVFSILGFGREKIECDSDKDVKVCRWSRPNQLLKDIGILDCVRTNATNSNESCDAIMLKKQIDIFWIDIAVLFAFILSFRLIAFYIMRYKLKH